MSPPRRNVVAVSVAVAIGKLLHGRSMREQLCRTQRILIRNDRSGRPLKSASAAALSPDDANLLPPAFVEREEIPLDRRGEIAQYGLCGRMNMQRGRDQIQARWKGRKLDATKVAMALELAKPGVWVCCLSMMMPHTNPVIKALQREVEIVLRFELEHREPAICSDSEKIEHTAIARACDRRNLGIDMLWIEMRKHA